MFFRYPHISTAMRLLPPVVVDCLREHAGIAHVAGGFLRAISMGNSPKSDIDIFFPGGTPSSHVDAIVSCMRFISRALPNAIRTRGVIVTDNAITIETGSYPVQLVRGFELNTIQDVLDAFDFTISKAAVWIEPTVDRLPSGTCDETFLRDIGTRSIVYDCKTPIVAPILSAKRIEKFLRQGFTLSTEHLVEYIRKCSFTPFTTIASRLYDQPGADHASTSRIFRDIAEAEAFIRSGTVITVAAPQSIGQVLMASTPSLTVNPYRGDTAYLTNPHPHPSPFPAPAPGYHVNPQVFGPHS